jgi:hypothetical protein
METARVKMGALSYLIILLTLFTAAVHLTLSFPDAMFILNGLGYLGLLAALYLPLPVAKDNRRLVRWAFIGYTALTIVLWVFLGARNMGAYADKLGEVLLIVCLWLEGRQP